MKINELDVVRVVQLNTEGRAFSGTEGVRRPPAIGDVGTVVLLLASDGSAMIVEMADDSGSTVWLADFSVDELELVWRIGSLAVPVATG